MLMSEDTVWTFFGVIGLTRKELQGHHSIFQRQHGLDVCKELFCHKRSNNANADTLNINKIMARHSYSSVSHLTASTKTNFGKRKTFFWKQVRHGKIKRKCTQIIHG